MSKQKISRSGNYKTEQEKFWAGEFGNDYISRNKDEHFHASNVALFSAILKITSGITSVVELGANIGLNMRALRCLLPDASLTGVEINEKACSILRRIKGVNAIHGSLFDARLKPHDMSFTKGVLIHLNPDLLTKAYEKLATSGRRYVAIIEYYNPSPVEISYRGHSQRLFKRDFAGEFMQKYPRYRLVDYGFVYRNDPIFPQDDLTWFLMENKTDK